jgi:DNA-binding transcriptional LysR family regulator
MELRGLRYFLAAAEEENFHRAAARLRIAQPALSRQISQLEQELGAALFERSRRRVRLSPAGKQYLADVRRILREVEEANRRARRVALGQIGVLRIGFHETAGRHPVVPRSLREFRAANPEVEVNFVQMTSPAQLEAIQDGTLDGGFAYVPPQLPPELDCIDIGRDELCLAMASAHPLAARASLRLKDLVNEPFVWIGRDVNPQHHDRVIAACLAGGLSPRIVHETGGEATLLSLVAVGMAVSFVAASPQMSPPPDIVLKRISDLRLTLRLALFWRPQPDLLLLSRFVANVRTLADEFAAAARNSGVRSPNRT